MHKIVLGVGIFSKNLLEPAGFGPVLGAFMRTEC